VVFNFFCTATPRFIVATHCANDPPSKLDQTKSITAVCIKNLHAPSPKNGSRPIWAVFPQQNVH